MRRPRGARTDSDETFSTPVRAADHGVFIAIATIELFIVHRGFGLERDGCWILSAVTLVRSSIAWTITSMIVRDRCRVDELLIRCGSRRSRCSRFEDRERQ